jgi:hypothetical protein
MCWAVPWANENNPCGVLCHAVLCHALGDFAVGSSVHL